jgi:anaerobic selenocysteine-containing dehydrogenase
MVVTVEEGRIVQVEGDALNPATRGKVCLKGVSYARRAATGDRLTAPLRRSSPGGDFEEVSWEEALTDIAAGLQRIRTDQGPLAVLYNEGSGSHGALSEMAEVFWRQFGGPTRTHGDLCWPAGLEATRLTYGDNRHNHPCLTTQSRFILLWGHNPAETNVHQMRLILDAQEEGARVAVVDPRSTDTTDAADVHLRPRPGTDAALALGMAHVIVEAGSHDTNYLARHAEGVDAYLERVREWPPDRAAEVAGVEPEVLVNLALEYARSRPALLIAGFGLQRHRQAGQTMRAVCLLPALTGNIGRAGGGWQYANLASHCLRPPPLPPAPGSPSRSYPTARLGRDILESADPPVRAAWFEKANPVSQHPRAEAVRNALEQLDLVVVVDQFLTETARLADYVLPAKTMFEQADLVTAYWHPYLQLRTKVLDPPDGVMTETGIWRHLCERSGFDATWLEVDEHELLRSMLPEGEENLLEDLAEQPVDPSGYGEIAWVEGDFSTPSGKIEFHSEEAARLWGVDPIPDYMPLEEGHQSERAGRYPLQLLTCKTRERIHSQFGNLDWVQEVERPRRLDISEVDAQKRGVGEGERVVVRNDRGQIEIDVHIDRGIRPGVVHVIEGRCTPEDPDLNVLIDDGVTDMNHGAIFYECLVEVERA